MYLRLDTCKISLDQGHELSARNDPLIVGWTGRARAANGWEEEENKDSVIEENCQHMGMNHARQINTPGFSPYSDP